MDTCCLFTNQQHRWISFSFFLFSILHKDFFIVLFQAAEARVFDNGFYFCISFHNIIRFVHAQHEDRHGYSYSSVAFLLIVFCFGCCLCCCCLCRCCCCCNFVPTTVDDERRMEELLPLSREFFFFISLHKAFVSYLIFFFFCSCLRCFFTIRAYICDCRIYLLFASSFHSLAQIQYAHWPCEKIEKKGKNTRVFASLIVSGRFLHEDSVTESITEKYKIFILFSNLSNSSEMIELKFNYGSVNCDWMWISTLFFVRTI